MGVDGVVRSMPRRGIGFWATGLDDPAPLPMPQGLVDPGWEVDRERVAAYLDAGRTLFGFFGHSWCRFGCAGALGCRDLTDGPWVWPAGLSHYIREHDVVLPDEVIAHMAAHGWSLPSGHDELGMYELDWWSSWSLEHCKPLPLPADALGFSQARALVDGMATTSWAPRLREGLGRWMLEIDGAVECLRPMPEEELEALCKERRTTPWKRSQRAGPPRTGDEIENLFDD